MTDFVVHSVPGSPFGRAVLATLEEKGADYRLQRIAMRTPAHLALHPFGRIPVLEHGDFKLFETQAILRYLDRVLPKPALTPADPRAAARMDQAMNVCDWYLFQGVGNIIGFERAVKPRLLGAPADEAAVAAALPRGQKVFGELAAMLGDAPYFAGDQVTLADLLLASHVDFFQDIPEWEALTGGHANLRAWIGRVNERPSMVATTWDRADAMAA